MKCDVCGAPVENGKCTYCGKIFAYTDSKKDSRYHYERPKAVYVKSNTSVESSQKYKNSESKQKKKISFKTIIFIFFAICIINALVSPNSSDSENKSVWATEDTSIDQFDYYLDGDYVYLQKYKGRDNKIKIGTSYDIEGKEYQVASELGGLFALKRVNSVILPEGIVTMENNIFNSCGVEYVYIPKSLKTDESKYGFYNYFHDVKKIYYGGSKEEWAILTNDTDRSEIDAIEIIYDASIEDLQ